MDAETCRKLISDLDYIAKFRKVVVDACEYGLMLHCVRAYPDKCDCSQCLMFRRVLELEKQA